MSRRPLSSAAANTLMRMEYDAEADEIDPVSPQGLAMPPGTVSGRRNSLSRHVDELEAQIAEAEAKYGVNTHCVLATAYDAAQHTPTSPNSMAPTTPGAGEPPRGGCGQQAVCHPRHRDRLKVTRALAHRRKGQQVELLGRVQLRVSTQHQLEE